MDIYRTVVETPTVAGLGNVPKMTNYLAGEFIAAGKKPILLLGHMDVVGALDKDWERPPFKLTQDDKYFYGRGSIDNKYGVSMLSATFIRLKKEGFVPKRDLIIVFSGDEETDTATTMMLANEMPDLNDAEFALNSDAGGGDLSKDGKAVAYLVQAAEKTYATFELTLRNPGGHSSRPRSNNAIYDLAHALIKIQNYHFPVQSIAMTREFFRISGQQLGGELGQAMVQFADDPNNKTASGRLESESSYVGSTRTTCVPTMLEAGHAENALPQSATATVNCRIFPGTSVMQVQKQLQQTIANDEVEFVITGDPIESPISEPRTRTDVMTAVSKAAHARYPEVEIMAYMD